MLRIKAVNGLVNAVAANTVRENDGLKPDLIEERKRAKEVLRLLLGREPSREEVNKCLADCWKD